MKNAILLHGWNTLAEFNDPAKPTASNDHWFPWLTKQLQLHGYKVDVPEMPQHCDTTYGSWLHEFERFDITSETLLVGYSLGGGFLVRYLSEHDTHVGRVILAAPWMGLQPDGARDESFSPGYFDFEIDRNLSAKTDGLTILYSDDDFDIIHQSIACLRHKLDDVEYTELQGKGHFTRDSLGAEAFPELLQLCLSK